MLFDNLHLTKKEEQEEKEEENEKAEEKVTLRRW